MYRHDPIAADGVLTTGRLGESLDQQAGYDAARQVGLCILATLRKELGSLDRVRRLVKLFAVVCCTHDFTALRAKGWSIGPTNMPGTAASS